MSAKDSNRSRSRKYLGIGPATEQDWPNCGQYGKLPPKRQLGDQTKHERSTMDLPGAGEDRGKEGNTPNEGQQAVQVSICRKGEIDPIQAHAWLTSP